MGAAQRLTRRGEDRQLGHDLHYQVARARGGVGLLVTGNRLVDPTSTAADFGYPNGYLRSAIASDRRITSAVHEHGPRIVAQLNHFGAQGVTDAADDPRVLLGPSAVKSLADSEVARAMDADDIAHNVACWARAAVQARDSGFDGVEISVVHSYLLHQFLSPIYNKRDDDYGGDLVGRMRLAREVIGAVRAAVGRDHVVGVRLVLSDFLDGGLEQEDAIDHVARLKAAVGELPVFAVGGIKDPAQAERVLAEGRADMVGMTRAQIADPEIVEKVRTGRVDEIRHCIRGNQGCISRFFRGLPISCIVNPVTGRERKYANALEPTRHPRSWVVVGGGPAGMQAAETLAILGHRVTLFEQAHRLGGQVQLILNSPGRAEFAWLVRDLERGLDAHGVDVRLGTPADAGAVLATRPDAVVVATGARPDRTGFTIVAPRQRSIPGADLPHVHSGWDVLAGTAQIGGGRVVVADDDGSRYPASVMEMLLDAGCQVELVTRFSSLLPGTVTTLEQPLLYKRLFEKGLAYRLNAWLSDISTGSEADAVVLVTTSHPVDHVFHALKGQVPVLERIGDCLAPRRLDHAVYEGFAVGAEMLDDRTIQEGELEAWPDGPPAPAAA